MRSFLVAPVWPSSWMEMAGLVAVDWIGRTDQHRDETSKHFPSVFSKNNKNKTHCFSRLRTLSRWGCDAAGSSCRTDSGSSGSPTPPLLQSHDVYFLSRCTWTVLSGLKSPTGAVQAAGQLRGHHLHDEADAEAEHVSEQGGLRAHVHGQVHHDFLHERQHTRHTQDRTPT